MFFVKYLPTCKKLRVTPHFIAIDKGYKMRGRTEFFAGWKVFFGIYRYILSGCIVFLGDNKARYDLMLLWSRAKPVRVDA